MLHPLIEQTSGIGVVSGCKRNRNLLNAQGSTRNGTLGKRNATRAINGRLPDTVDSPHWLPPTRKPRARRATAPQVEATITLYRVKRNKPAPRHRLTDVASFLMRRGWTTDRIRPILDLHRDRPAYGTDVELVMSGTWQKDN